MHCFLAMYIYYNMCTLRTVPNVKYTSHDLYDESKQAHTHEYAHDILCDIMHYACTYVCMLVLLHRPRCVAILGRLACLNLQK